MNHPTTQIHVEPETMNKPDNTKQTVEYKATCSLDSTTASNSTFGDGTSSNINAATADINANSDTQSQEGILFKIMQSEIERKVEELNHVRQAYHYSRFHNTNLPPDQACFTVLQVHANNFEPRWFRIELEEAALKLEKEIAELRTELCDVAVDIAQGKSLDRRRRMRPCEAQQQGGGWCTIS